MRCVLLAAAIAGAIALEAQAAPAPAVPAEPERPSRKCDIGPTKKVFGTSDWLVYGCEDAKTIVIVSAPGNPAFPFYFIFFPENGAYRLYGEGTGRKEPTKAAFDELQALTPQQTIELITEANGAKK